MQFFPLDLPGKVSTVLDLRFGLFPPLSAGFELTLQFCCSSWKSDSLFEERARSLKRNLQDQLVFQS